MLSSDQDHAIAYELPRARRGDAAAHDYFTALAGLVVPALARAGMPLCAGGYMATNWCRPLGEYERLFRSWVEEPATAGTARRPRSSSTSAAATATCRPTCWTASCWPADREDPFRVQMARAAVTFRPPSGWFSRLRSSGSTMDVKLGGTAAIVLLARLYALTAGSTEHSTVPRLQSRGGRRHAQPRQAPTSLIEAYRFLTELRLRHQVEQIGQGLPADNRISVDRLTIESRQRLRTTLRLVRDMQDITAMRFSTSSVT